MKQITTAILLMAMMAGFASCRKEQIGEGPITTQTRSVSNFGGIILQMNGDVYYTNAPEWKLEVTAKESIHSILETKVVNNRLVIRYNNGRTYDADGSIRIHVSGPGLSSFELNTSGSVYAQNTIEAANLYLAIGGSGSIVLRNVDAGNIDAINTGSGRITAAGGHTVNEKLRTEGSGRIDLSAVAAKTATARIIGSGDIRVKVADRLDARIDGSGDIYFTGSPFLNTDINGSGKLIRF